MSETVQAPTTDLVDLAGDIVVAYVSNNAVRPSDLPDLIRTVHAALDGLADGTAAAAPEPEIEKPTAAQVRKSVTPDGIVSFLDGKTYKSMKRHLTTKGFDPKSYRLHFGLPADYPIVAASYAAQRSALAKSIGLGRGGARNSSEQPKAQGRKKAA